MWELQRPGASLAHHLALFDVIDQVHLQSFLFGLVCQGLHTPNIRQKKHIGVW